MMHGLEESQLERWRETPSKFVEEIVGVAEVFDYQKEFLDHDSNYRAFVSGRQVGKSRSCAWLAIHYAMVNPDSTVLLLAPTQRQSSELMNQIKKEISISEITKDRWGIERSIRTEIEWANGSRILSLPTGRDGSNIRGYTADLIIVDEAAYIEDEIFENVLEPMLVVTDGGMVLASTPFGTSGYFYERCSIDDDYATFHIPTIKNPLVNEAFIKKKQRQLPDMQFRQEYLGEFVEQADLFFSSRDIKNCLNNTDDIASVVTKTTDGCYLGADIAQHGEDESVFVSMDADGNVFDITHTSDTDLTDSIGRIQKLDAAHQYDDILIDATGLGQGVVDVCKERIGRRVEGYKFNSIDKKQSLYQNARRQMQDGEITFELDDEGRVLKEQLSGMKQSFTSTGKIKVEEPDTGFDDYSDAFVLAAWARGDDQINGNYFTGSVDMGSLR